MIPILPLALPLIRLLHSTQPLHHGIRGVVAVVEHVGPPSQVRVVGVVEVGGLELLLLETGEALDLLLQDSHGVGIVPQALPVLGVLSLDALKVTDDLLSLLELGFLSLQGGILGLDQLELGQGGSQTLKLLLLPSHDLLLLGHLGLPALEISDPRLG